MTVSCPGAYCGFGLHTVGFKADLGTIHRVQVGADDGEHRAPTADRDQGFGVHIVPRGHAVPQSRWSLGCMWSPSPHPARPGWWEGRAGNAAQHSLVAAAGNNSRNRGVRAVFKGLGCQELLPINPQGHLGCTQTSGSGSRAPNGPITLPGDTAAVAGGDSRAAEGSLCQGSHCTRRDGAGVYLGCPARGHVEPLTITRQLLPAKRWVP